MAEATPQRTRSDPSSLPPRALTRRALSRAEAGKALSVDEAEGLIAARGQDLDRLMLVASGLRELGHGSTITYSRKVFIPLTMLCRDHCHYCTFAKPPAKLERPFLSLEEVRARREIQRLHRLQEKEYRVDQLIGDSEGTRRLRELIGKLARSEAATILIHGESGTGKELVARGLHYESSRRDSPFMEVNCAAITETLFESELFGHEKGAFTDAKAAKKGLMELADRGTLFLDEVSEMSLNSQAKFLRVLQERVLRRVGGTRDIKVDLRIIAATNRPLEARVKDGQFREDLFYRLNVIPIHIPPLRERRDDVLPLARHFVLDANTRFHKSIKGFTPDAERMMAPLLASRVML